jgi:hypothetical protein
MLADTDLTETEAVRPERRAVQPKTSSSLPRKRRRFWLFLLANLIIWPLVYTVWAGKEIRIWEFLTGNRRLVTGIMYSKENPCAVIRGKIVHEGDTVAGYKVLEICKNEVLLEKKGKTFVKRVR